MSSLNGAGTPVELVGGSRSVRFTINGLIQVEEHYGSIDACRQALNTQPLTATRYLLHVALRDPNLSLEQVGELMEEIPLEPLVETLGKELLRAFGKEMPTATGAEPEKQDVPLETMESSPSDVSSSSPVITD